MYFLDMLDEFLGGFNRNIVECKYVAISGGNSNREVLIETLWNVNLSTITAGDGHFGF